MLQTEIVDVRYADLAQLGGDSKHENARYMRPDQFKRLVENIKRDGCLTSLPLVARIKGETPLYIVSGNHRVQAAIEGGLDGGPAIRIKAPLERSRFVAIQLAHNAIEGEDDPVTLRRLYDSLDLEFKEYSGLSDNDFNVDDFNVATFGSVSALYQDLVISFLCEDAESVKEFIARAAKWAKKNQPMFAADYADFDRFFSAIVRTKRVKGVTNTAVAIRLMADLASAQLDQIEAAKAAEQEPTGA